MPRGVWLPRRPVALASPLISVGSHARLRPREAPLQLGPFQQDAGRTHATGREALSAAESGLKTRVRIRGTEVGSPAHPPGRGRVNASGVETLTLEGETAMDTRTEGRGPGRYGEGP